MKFPISILSLGILGLAMVAPIGVDADTMVTGDITSDTEWTVADSPYILSGHHSVYIYSGVTLTIDSGVVVKFDKIGTLPYNGYADMFVQGNLVAKGNISNPIYFTSITDDSVGGDSNGDGEASTPTPGDWQGINFESGSNAIFQNAVVRYAAPDTHGAALLNIGGNLSISYSTISKNKRWGVYQGSGTTTIDHSQFTDEDSGVHHEGGSVFITNSQFSNTVTGLFTFVTPGEIDFENNTFSGNKEAAEISLGQATIAHSGNIFTNNTYNGIYLTGEPAGNFTLDNTSDGPYIGGFQVKTGTTVTLGPGVVLKFPPGRFFNIYGKLVANGTPENKVYITSLKDDLAGGDTNGDGGATTPVPVDWGRIAVSDTGELELNNTVVRYGGYADGYEGIEPFNSEISSIGGSINITNSEITDSGVGILSTAGLFHISSSTIERNFIGINSAKNGSGVVTKSRILNNKNYGVFNQSNFGFVVDARDNWWGDTTGPQHYLLNPNGLGNGASDNVNFTPWLTSDSYVVAEGITKPVIVIPGIMGSAYKNGAWIIDPNFHVYDNLVKTLEYNGYVASSTIFTFGYDWRNSNVDTAVLLKNKIDEIKNICKCEKVDVVAHSMGGLVARDYVESNIYGNDIDHLIFLGTPHKGAPQDYLAWEAGEFQNDYASLLLKSSLLKDAKRFGYSSLYNYVQNWPITSVRELLPTYDYLKVASSSQVLSYPSGYPTNSFLTTLNQNLNTLFYIKYKHYQLCWEYWH